MINFKVIKLGEIMKLYFILLSLFINLYGSDYIKLTTNEWNPYILGKEEGFIEEILKETFSLSNQEVKIYYNSFDEGYNDTLNGVYDGTFPYFFTKEREKSFLYSDPLFEVENVLFYNKRNLDSLNDIFSRKIGLVKGYAYNNIDLNRFADKKYFDNELTAFDMLNSGKIDLLPANKLVGIHIIKKYFNDFYSNIDFIKDAKVTSKDFFYLILANNTKNKNIIKVFNKSLRKLKQSGKFKEILLNNQEQINENLSDVVKLVNNTESFPMVVASDESNSNLKYIIPRGTKAVVIEWSKHFIEKGSIKVYDEMFKKTKVRIVNGPLKGKVLYIENMYIEID